MRGWQALLFSLAVAAAVAALFVLPKPGAPALAATGSASAPAASGAPSPAGTGATASPAPSGTDAPVDVVESDAGTILPGGQPAPSLAAQAPQSVLFGVIVVGYRGAQGSGTQRTREEAEKLAKQLAEEAKKDFKAALAKGDKESLENAGRMYRNMLEPAPEYVLFSLGKGEVSEPVDTPRGFWIAKRID